MSVENIAKDNDGVKYLLIVIDILSRFLLVRPLMNKKTSTVVSGMQDVLTQKHFTKIRSDKGVEFLSNQFKSLLKDKGIYFFITQNVPKANYAERVERPLET